MCIFVYSFILFADVTISILSYFSHSSASISYSINKKIKQCEKIDDIFSFQV